MLVSIIKTHVPCPSFLSSATFLETTGASLLIRLVGWLKQCDLPLILSGVPFDQTTLHRRCA